MYLCVVYNREEDWSDCQSAVTQTPLIIRQPATHAATFTQPGAIYEPILPDRRTRPCTGAFMNMITHTPTQGSTRNVSFSKAFTWALFALLNVNISTIFTPASILPRLDVFWDPEILMHLQLNWCDCFFFLISRAAQTLFKYRRGKRTPPLLGEMSWCSFPLDKLSRGPHAVSCVIGCVSLDFILPLLPGHHECVCAQWLAGYWQGVGVRASVSVCVCLHRLPVRMYLWMCIPLPLVFLTSRTLTSSERGSYHPQPVIIQNYFKSLLKGGYSALITAAANIIARRVWKSHRRHLQPPLFIFCVWRSSRPRLSSHWSISSPVLLSGLIRASEKRGRPKQDGVLWPSSRTRAGSYSDRGFQKLTCRGHTARGTIDCVTSSSLAISTWMRFHYLAKGTRARIGNAKKKRYFLYLSSVLNNITHMRCKTVWELHLWLLHWLISSNALGSGQQWFISSGGKMEIYSSSVLECFLLLYTWTYKVNIVHFSPLHLFAGIATN